MSIAPRPAPAEPASPASAGANLGSTPQPPRGGGYEFADADKERFRALAASVSFVGVCTMLFGVLSCVFCAGALYSGLLAFALGAAAAGALFLVTAWWMVSAGRSLSALVVTHGKDIEDLMEAVADFRRLFGLARVVIVVVAMALVAVGGVAVWCNLVLERGGKCLALPWGG